MTVSCDPTSPRGYVIQMLGALFPMAAGSLLYGCAQWR